MQLLNCSIKQWSRLRQSCAEPKAGPRSLPRGSNWETADIWRIASRVCRRKRRRLRLSLCTVSPVHATTRFELHRSEKIKHSFGITVFNFRFKLSLRFNFEQKLLLPRAECKISEKINCFLYKFHTFLATSNTPIHHFVYKFHPSFVLNSCKITRNFISSNL